ncbi:unnamed protein product [Acanthoscelides obtectus]|uniref:Uncharacterized protein n=1 Tax=Acanthoscelides obtectus TaxID=200917 RepID=A0A9P0K153_ACAOB|nr:unnamed protein product [Acanthoscelides obtectus]CAK1627483.1 hypothetical protein AOBTE_LOCUS4625 [Acanthoscelides obtectus]
MFTKDHSWNWCFKINKILQEGEMHLSRMKRSPTLLGKRHHGGLLLGGGLLGHGGVGPSGGGGGQYVTNINNYGPSHAGVASHPEVDHHVNYGHGQGGGSFAASGAAAGSHGQAQSQSAAFSLGPYSASFSQSQAQGGRRGIFDLFD